MNLIPDNVDLSQYMDGPDFKAKVRSARDFQEAVKAKLNPPKFTPKAPSMLLRKGGGIEFRPAEVTAWVGFNGHRKSMFTSQLMLDMAVQRQRVLIVSLEMDPADTMLRMVKQASGEAAPNHHTVDDFHTWTDGRLWLFDHVGNLSVDHAFALCRYFATELNGTQVILDSMMMICQSEEKLDEQKRFSTGLIRLAQETGLHIHVVTHCRKPQAGGEEKLPTRYEIRGSSAISDQSHNVMIVWMNKAKYAKLEENPNNTEAGSQPCAVIKCDKQRNGRWEGKLALWFHEPSLRFCDDRTSEVQPYAMLREEAYTPDLVTA
jgi:twinkle protein